MQGEPASSVVCTRDRIIVGCRIPLELVHFQLRADVRGQVPLSTAVGVHGPPSNLLSGSHTCTRPCTSHRLNHRRSASLNRLLCVDAAPNRTACGHSGAHISLTLFSASCHFDSCPPHSSSVRVTAPFPCYSLASKPGFLTAMPTGLVFRFI